MSVWNNLKTWLKQLSTELFADENGVAGEVKKLAAPVEAAVDTAREKVTGKPEPAPKDTAADSTAAKPATATATADTTAASSNATPATEAEPPSPPSQHLNKLEALFDELKATLTQKDGQSASTGHTHLSHKQPQTHPTQKSNHKS